MSGCLIHDWVCRHGHRGIPGWEARAGCRCKGWDRCAKCGRKFRDVFPLSPAGKKAKAMMDKREVR